MKKPPATQASLAEELGISRATVAEILGGKNAHRYNEETRRRVIEAAKEKGYRPNRSARLLTGARSGVIGIIKSISPFKRNAEFVLHTAEAINEGGYEVLSGDIYWHGGGLDRAVTALLDARAEGVVIAHMSVNRPLDSALKRLVEAGIPLVSMGGDPHEAMPYVTPDYFQAAEIVVSHLAACGYDKIAMLARRNWDTPRLCHYPGTRAVKGFIHAARQAGYAGCDVDVIVPPPSPSSSGSGAGPGVDLGMSDTRDFIETMIRRRGTARCGLVFLTEHQAMLAIQLCHQHGLSLPEQVGIVAFDGGYAADYLWPSLTAVSLPTREVAHRAVDILFKRMKGENFCDEPVLQPCQLVTRGSTREAVSPN